MLILRSVNSVDGKSAIDLIRLNLSAGIIFANVERNGNIAVYPIQC